MTLPPDQLFRDRLGNFQKKAPTTAWDRIETQLDHKKGHIPWMKIAAGLILLLATSLLLWPSSRNQRVASSTTIQNQNITSNEQLPVERKPVEPSLSQKVLSEDNALTNGKEEVTKHLQPEIATGKSIGIKPLNREKDAQPVAANELVSGTQASQPEIQETESIPVAMTEPEPIQSVATAEVAPNRASIAYTAEEVAEKFLKKEKPTDATPDRKNTSGLQKVVAVALDFKYEESVVGELRDIKNEWLSFNPSSKKRQLNK